MFLEFRTIFRCWHDTDFFLTCSNKLRFFTTVHETPGTPLRRSTAFRAQGRREMKQVVQPAQREAMRPVETRIMAPVETRIVAPCETGITVSVETRSGAGCPDSCSTSDHTQVHESPPAAQGTHHSDGTKTQHGVSCTGSLTKERGEDAGRAKAAALRGSAMGAQKQQNTLSETVEDQLLAALGKPPAPATHVTRRFQLGRGATSSSDSWAALSGAP